MNNTSGLYNAAIALRDQFNKNVTNGLEMTDETNVTIWRAHQEIVSFLHAVEGEIVDYGYAPGTYLIRCVHCKSQSLADKRATSCWLCAKLEERKRDGE